MIDGFGLAGYRSFGREMQFIAPCKKVNLLIGANNCGKSNVLRFICEHFSAFLHNEQRHSRRQESVHPIDLHRDAVGEVPMAMALPMRHDAILELLNGLNRHEFHEPFKKVLAHPSISPAIGLAWHKFRVHPKREDYYDFPEDVVPLMHGHVWHGILRHVSNRSSSGKHHDSTAPLILFEAFKRIHGAPKRFKTYFVHAIRQITPEAIATEADESALGERSTADRQFTGAGLAKSLQKLQSPTYDQQHEKQKFETIRAFLRELTGDDSATFDIPHDWSTINVHMNGRVLPIESVGTGIQEVFIIAAEATIVSDSVICLEEPELHLHPILQRKLIRYLLKSTSNQYFIATHSAHFMDVESDDVAIFHLRLESGATKVMPTLSGSERRAVCDDLGYRPSDLLQANCVVWVEGPSDRLYIRHWLKAFDGELIENVHFTIMFYGGSLSCHLSVLDETDPEFQELIRLPQICRYFVFVADSDRKRDSDPLKPTIVRLQAEWQRSDLHGRVAFWVTSGRTIENYLPHSIAQAAVESAKKGFGAKVRNGKFFAVAPETAPGRCVSKIGIAHGAIQSPANLDHLDLRERIHDVAALVRKANGLEPRKF